MFKYLNRLQEAHAIKPLVFGSGIFAINLYTGFNCYDTKTPFTPLQKTEIVFHSTIKGLVYAFWYPFPIIDMIGNMITHQQTKITRHFFPGSVYGTPKFILKEYHEKSTKNGGPNY